MSEDGSLSTDHQAKPKVLQGYSYNEGQLPPLFSPPYKRTSRLLDRHYQNISDFSYLFNKAYGYHLYTPGHS